MGDSKQKTTETETAHAVNVAEEPIASQKERRENVKGILYGRQFSGKLGSADDPLESKADSIANRILSEPIERGFRFGHNGTINSNRRHLSSVEKAFFEPKFGTDLSGVKLNYSFESSKFAKGINARAFTHGSEIHFSSADIDTQSPSGLRTIAHELAHVVQNRNSLQEKNTIRREVEHTGRVEYSTRYRNSEGELRDDADERELAVLVRVFYNLQRAGLIDESEHLGDDLNYCQRAAMGTIMDEMGVDRGITGCSVPTTYEAALRVLVTDADDNGRFDVNIDALYRSRLTNLPQNSCVNTGVIELALNAELNPSGDWLDDQSDDADHSNDFFGQSTQFVDRFGRLTDEGDAVRGQDESYVITDVERYYWRARNNLRGLIAEDQFEQIVTNAIAAANDLNNAGGMEQAAKIMAFAFRATVNNMTLTDRLISALDQSQPLARILDQEVDIRLSSSLRFGLDSHEGIDIDTGANTFIVTLGRLVELIQIRRDFVNTVDAAVEGDVQLTPTLSSMTEYMHQLVRTASLDDVKTALGNALSSQFVHSGDGVDYDGFPGETRSSNMQGLYDALSQDGAGRYVIDCDGFVAFARHFLDAGTNRFGFVFMDRRTRSIMCPNCYDASTHAMMAVLELQSQQGFIVDNENIHGEFTFVRGCSDRELIDSIGEGLRSAGTTSPMAEVYMSLDQSIYDAGDDPNRWNWSYWSPGQE